MLMRCVYPGLAGIFWLLSSTCNFAHGAQLLFTDQTASAGIDASTHIGTINPILGGGVVADFNQDGWQDIYYPTGGNGPDKLYLNNANGTFTDHAAAWGLTESHYSSAATVGDYNGDDLPDLFVTCFGPNQTPQIASHHLYRNTGDGFVEESVAAGINQCSTLKADGWGGAWGDMDLDGDLDLLISGFIDRQTGNCLMRNNGDNTFTNITASSGLAPAIQGLAGYTPHFADMDNDRYPEIIWIGDFSTSLYFVNNGDGTFTDATDSSNTSMDNSEMGMAVGDWNEDGLFDFFVSTIGTNNLYINQDNHQYINQADSSGVTVGGFGWAAVSFDMDHDSRFDLMNVAQVGGNSVYLNHSIPGQVIFQESAASIGLGFNSDGRGLANFDYDNDGDQDLIFFPGGQPIILMRNDLSGTDTHWLRVFLDRDGVTNIPAQGIGSKISVVINDRTIYDRIDGGSNYLSQSEASAHFGLNDVEIIDMVRVEWSNGMITELHNITANQTLTMKPPDNVYQNGFE